jgi:hypothetical protein
VDVLQAFRMTAPWPLIVGSAAFLLARSVFWFTDARLGRDQAIACGIVGASGGIVAWAIAVAWDNSEYYWIAFTLGLSVLALVMLVTVVQLAVEMYRQ